MSYNWTRCWAPEETEPELRKGFLAHSERSYRPFINPRPGNNPLVTLPEINAPCAVLLGEPGIGKTTEVRNLYENLTQESDEPHQVLHVELGMISGYPSLEGELLNTQEVQGWIDGEHRLTLILDALDECGLDRKTHFLKTKLFATDYPAENLTLRITCRASDWPESLNRSFCQFWELDDLPVYHLAPLRREDAIQAAESVGIEDGETFLEAVIDADAGPSAASPLTLRALLSSFQENGEIPDRKADLFEEYCLRLSREENENRREANETGILDQERRVDILSRIAALMIFGGHTRLCLQPRASDTADALGEGQDVLFVDEVRSERNSSRIDGPNVDAIRDAVRHSGLMRGSDEGRTFRWRHRSFAEYLTARFICDHGFPVEQVRPLIEHEYDGAIAPHCQNVAVWLATLDHDMMEYLFEKDPSLVLAGDPLQYGDEIRRRLVTAILEGVDRGSLDSRRNERLYNLEEVEHPQIEDQLQEWISDESRSEDAREYALRLARKQELEGLVDQAITLTLDSSVNKYLRIWAIRLINEAGESEDRETLRTLATDPGEEDQDRRVVYEAREALLPDLINFEDLVELIHADAEWAEPKKIEGNWYHTLDQWSNSISRRLDRTTLQNAFNWALFEDSPLDLSSLRRSITRRAIREHVDDGEIATTLAMYLTEQVCEQHTIRPHVDQRDLERVREEQPDAYRNLIRKVIRKLAEYTWEDKEKLRVVIQGFRSPGFWMPEDTEWLLEDLEGTEEETVERVYAAVIRSFFDRNGFPDPDGFSRIYEASQSSLILRNQIAKWLDPVELESERAEELRKQERQYRSWDPDPMEPPFRQRLSDALDLCKDDVVAGWKELCELLTRSSIEEKSARQKWHRDVTQLPAWKEMSSPERGEVMNAGLDYLRTEEIEKDNWLSETSRAIKWWISSSFSDSLSSGYRPLLIKRICRPLMGKSGRSGARCFSPMSRIQAKNAKRFGVCLFLKHTVMLRTPMR